MKSIASKHSPLFRLLRLFFGIGKEFNRKNFWYWLAVTRDIQWIINSVHFKHFASPSSENHASLSRGSVTEIEKSKSIWRQQTHFYDSWRHRKMLKSICLLFAMLYNFFFHSFSSNKHETHFPLFLFIDCRWREGGLEKGLITFSSSGFEASFGYRVKKWRKERSIYRNHILCILRSHFHSNLKQPTIWLWFMNILVPSTTVYVHDLSMP